MHTRQLLSSNCIRIVYHLFEGGVFPPVFRTAAHWLVP